ncbi:MAG TPA: MaoC family dehydratase N-terminal domain-containing protein [Acidimicrobiales bacterium]|nr:MaoC family dehydratase N-terminal domain-containing protein [Acidimicrobiales bacterium]
MSYEIPIERGKIREFARATQSRNPAYEGPGAVIPPTFLTTAQHFWATDFGHLAELGFNLARLLHGEEEYEFFGPPPHAGQTLTATSRLGDRWEKEGKRGGVMRFAKTITEFRDETGRLVAEQRTTIIETARPPKEES